MRTTKLYPARGSAYTDLRKIRKYRYVIYNLITSNLRSRYRRSVLGFLWSLLNPLLTMLILAFVFSSLYRLSMSEFGLYVFSGLLPWQLIANSAIGATTSITSAEGFLKKVSLPPIIFPIVTVGIEVANFLFSLLGLSIIAIIWGLKGSLALVILLPTALLLLVIFILGLALLISTFSVYFRDLPHLLSVGFMGLFYLTPIIYQKSLLPVHLIPWLKLNPFYHFIDIFHQLLYANTIPDMGAWAICALLAILSLWLGLIVFKSREKNLIYRL